MGGEAEAFATGGRAWWRSIGGECGPRKCASVIAIENVIWSGTLSGSPGANVTVTVILTSTSTLIATGSPSAKPPLTWSVIAILRADCTHDHGPLCSHCCLDLCFVTGIGVCHGVLRGCDDGCVVWLAMDRECVLVLSLDLALTLGSCARHCRRFACAAWRTGQQPFPRAQDLTWLCDLSVAPRN